MIYCGKVEFGQIFRSRSLNSGAIRLTRPKNLPQIGSLVKSDFVGAGLASDVHVGAGHARDFFCAARDRPGNRGHGPLPRNYPIIGTRADRKSVIV